MQIAPKSVTARRSEPTVLPLILGALLIFPPPTLAEKSPSARIDELERKLQQSLQQIERLSTEVAALRAAQSNRDTTPGNATTVTKVIDEQSAKIEKLEREIERTATPRAARDQRFDGIQLHGFADVGAGTSSQANLYQTGPKGFTLSNFSLYLTPGFGDRIKSLTELVFEVDHDGEVVVDLERLQVGYTFSDAATLWGGRFHTPYGIWNTAYHHGQQLQTSLSRPRFLDFEDRGGILPSHTIGAWVPGTVSYGNMRFNYDLYVGNGPRIDIDSGLPAPGGNLNPSAGGDNNHSLQYGLRAEVAPRGAWDGLKLGLHALRVKVNDNSAFANSTRVLTYGPYLSYTSEHWEILSEYYRFSNEDLSGDSGTHHSNAWYTQAAYLTEFMTPYMRLERASLATADNYFAFQNSGHSYYSAALGLRFDLALNVALKFEAGRTRLKNVTLGGGDDLFSEFRTQISVRY